MVLLNIPLSIGRQFEGTFSYNNFMKPFYTFDNLPLITVTLKKKIDKAPLSHLVIFPFVKTAAFLSDVTYEENGGTNTLNGLWDIAVEYLRRLNELCAARG